MTVPSKETEEKIRHSTPFIPYSFYECRIPYDHMKVPMHWHSEFELNFTIRGSGEFICGTERFIAEQGDILLLPPNTLHGAQPRGVQGLYYYALVFSPLLLGANTSDRCTAECIRPLVNGTRRLRMHIPKTAASYQELEKSAKTIFACARGDMPKAELLLKAELLRLFWLLETLEAVGRGGGHGHQELVRPALEFMMGNFRENITVDRLAELSHLSKSYFMSCFRKAVGISAIEYLSQLRLNAACESIAQGEERISQIAFSCGFGNLSNFNRQFRRAMGCSPKEYRALCQSGTVSPGLLTQLG